MTSRIISVIVVGFNIGKTIFQNNVHTLHPSIIAASSNDTGIDEIKPYLGTKLDAVVLKYALSYTLQSLRNNENMNKFKWGDIECFIQ